MTDELSQRRCEGCRLERLGAPACSTHHPMTDKLAAAENALAVSQAQRIEQLEAERRDLIHRIDVLCVQNSMLLAAQGELDEDTRAALTERGHLIGERLRLRSALATACEMLERELGCTCDKCVREQTDEDVDDRKQLATWKAMAGES